MRKIARICLLIVMSLVSVNVKAEPARLSLTIRTDFPGANALVSNNTGSSVNIAPDLRGDNEWFYWCFEATVNKPGQVDFILPINVTGANGAVDIGRQGPAVSYDDGDTWDWMGTSTVDSDSFKHTFTPDQLTVRFAVTLPYLQKDLDEFLAENASNPHLSKSILAQTNGGLDVELLQIGQPGSGKGAVLFTCRHHACETIASYVLQGFMKEAISNSSAGVAFRNNYVLYVVPFVDKDGVQAGDQGKNRKPHDHNRDYNKDAPGLYPEIDAIEALAIEKRIQYVMDCHCPTLLMDIHQRVYFSGPDYMPIDNYVNVSAFSSLIDEEMGPAAPAGPVNTMNAKVGRDRCARSLCFLPGMIMSTNLEFGYAPRGKDTSPDNCLGYGAAFLRAWNRMDFQYATEYNLTVNNGSGNGSYIGDDVIDISANAPTSGQVFDRWTGSTAGIANIYDPTTTITMPESNATVTATHKIPGTLYTLTVANGTGDGNYSVNAVVDIEATIPQGYDFLGWTGDTKYLLDPGEEITSITAMPSHSITVTATYEIHTLHLLGHWTLDETSGALANDLSGLNNDLEPYNSFNISAMTTTGVIGNAMRFEGDNSAALKQSTLLKQMPDALTIAGWIKPTTGFSRDAIWCSKMQTGTSPTDGKPIQQLWLMCGSRGMRVSYRSGSTAVKYLQGITPVANTWYHYVFTWDEDGMALYIDGQLKGTNTEPIMDDEDSSGFYPLLIGTGWVHVNAFEGVIDDVRVYSDVLTQEEVTELYNSAPH